MPFTVSDFHDLVNILHQRPEWRDELRRLVLTEEILTLPDVVRDLVEAQRRTEQRVEELAEAQRRTEQRVEELAEAQRRTEQRVEELAEAQRRTEQRVEELAEAQRRTEQRVEELAEALRALAEAQKHTETQIQRMEAQFQRMDAQIQRLTDRVAVLDGRMLEISYLLKPDSYFGRMLRRARVANRDDLEDLLEGHLTAEQIDDVLRLDLTVRGRLRQAPAGEERPEVWLAVEVSAVIDRGDVERAERRAVLMRQAGLSVLSLVAGEKATKGAMEKAKTRGVVLLTDGRMDFLEEALLRHFSLPHGG